MKGQISVEHIVLLGVVLVVLLPGIYIFYNNTLEMKEEFDNSRVISAGEDIIDTVSKINVLGDRTKETLTIDLPENFRDITIVGNNTIVVTYEDTYGISQAIFVSEELLQGPTNGIPLEEIKPGKNKVAIQNYEGTVCISHQGGDCAPACGNQVIDASLSEVCDGAVLGGLRCSDYGYTTGTLVCKSDCSGVDTQLCFGCGTTGPVCIDEGIQSDLTSTYVEAPLGVVGGGSPEIKFTPNAFTLLSCGEPGMYEAKSGGGVKLNTGLIGISPGINSVKITAHHINDNLHQEGDIGIQCDGVIIDIPRTATLETYADVECIFESATPDLRILSHGKDWVNFDKIQVEKICDAGACENVYDSGFHCLSENTRFFGNYIISDYMTFLATSAGEGFAVPWIYLQSSNPLAEFPDYEDVCGYAYLSGPSRFSHNTIWEIKGPNFVNLIDGPGEYWFMLNAGFADKTEPSSFELTCGNNPPVPLKHTTTQPRTEEYMETLVFDCNFNGDANDQITITSNGPSSTLYVEQFRLRKKCT